MKVHDLEIPGLKLIEHAVFNDPRGYFFECFNSAAFEKNNLPVQFFQDNISKSAKDTIRGLHYQAGKNAQGKLCQVLHGTVLDVAVDIRFGSPTFGQYGMVELSGENKSMLWIPPGFAHGFSVLSDEAIFYYKCTAPYSKNDERTILYNDPQLGIAWRVENPLISDKDTLGKAFADIDKDFIYTEE